MIIQRSGKIVKAATILCAVSAVLGLLLAFRSFAAYLLFMVLVNALLAFIFYRGTAKDWECFVAIFGLLALYSVFQVFTGGDLSLLGGVIALLRIAGYIAFVAYLLGVSSNKRLPIIGAIAIVLVNLWNSVQLILSFRNLGTMLGSLGGGLSPRMIWSLLLNLLTVLIYTVPIVITATLIAVNAIQIVKKEGGIFVSNPEKDVSAQQSQSTVVDPPIAPTQSPETSGSNDSVPSPGKSPISQLKIISKKVWIIVGIAIAAILAMVIALRVVFSPINKFSRALSNKDFAQAQQIFDGNLHDNKFAEDADKKLENYLDSVRNSYINDEISYEEAQTAANSVDSMISAQDTLNVLKIVFDSKTVFKNAEESESNGDFYKAIEQYEKISPEDTKNYAAMEDRIAAAKVSLVSKALADAESSVKSGDHDTAITTLVSVQKAGYATPEIDSALLDTATSLVESCKTAADYYSAYDKIKSLDLEGIGVLLDQAISAASVVTVSEAQSLISQQKYIEAFNALSTPKGDFVTPEIESALKNCTDLAAGAILSEVDSLKANSQYKEAYELLHNTNSKLFTDAMKTAKDECENLYKNAVLASADQLASNGDYDGAIAEINEGKKLLSDSDLTNKAEEYKLEKLKAEQLVTVESTKVKQSFIYNEAYVTIKNRTDKVLKEYVVAIIMLDSHGYPVNNTYSHKEYHGYKNVYGGRADSANVQPGKTYGGSSYWNIEGDCDKILACVVSAEFYDGTTWTNPYLEPWLKAYAEKPIN